MKKKSVKTIPGLEIKIEGDEISVKGSGLIRMFKIGDASRPAGPADIKDFAEKLEKCYNPLRQKSPPLQGWDELTPIQGKLPYDIIGGTTGSFIRNSILQFFDNLDKWFQPENTLLGWVKSIGFPNLFGDRDVLV